jgi:Outer membrane protein beta-barrel family/CarboxypepD_reg-like domain/TonB-dependent Receptor Plug Domain
MMTKFCLVISLLMACCFSIDAQTKVTGKAIDDKTGQGIGFVSVSLLSPKDSTFIKGQVTDTAGIFELPDLPDNRYLLLFSAFGYSKLYRDVILDNVAGHTMHLGNISMNAVTSQLNEVVVSGAKPVFQRQADKLVLNIAGNPLFAAAANTLDILKKTPGLQVNGDGTIQMSGGITPTVFIDGKPVPMSPEELQNYLASLSPDMIASLEIITNPSSKYNGEYKGIIDIRLKRDLTLGWKGTVSTNMQQNAYHLADNNLSLTYKAKRISYTARLGYTTGKSVYQYSALQHLANTNIMATNTQVLTGNNNFNYQLGADYSLSKTQHIELMARTYQSNRDIYSFNTLHTTDATAEKLMSASYSINNGDPKQRTYAVHLNYSAQLGNSQLDILTSLLKINNGQNEDIQTKNTATHYLLDYWKTDLQNDILVRTAQADLSGNAGKGKWSAGGRFAFTTTNNQLRYDTLTHAAIFVPDSSRTNSFQYDEYVTAAYLAYDRTVRKWSYAVSLRAEHTHSIGTAISQHEQTKRDYITWLPGFSFTFPIRASQQLHLSYSRRMTRPNFAQLNPFRFYNSPLNYYVGNPNLQPSKTDMLTVAYTRRALNISLYLGRESDPMARYPEYDPVTNVLEYLGRNLPYNDFAGVEVSFPLTINTWWKMNHNIRGAYKKEQTPYHDVMYAIPIFDYSFSGSQLFSLPYGITFDLSYSYRSAGGNGLYTTKALGSVDPGIQKSWMKGKLNSRINYYDIFDTYAIRLKFREKKIIDNELRHWFGNRKVSVSLQYSFGKSTHKSRQENKSEEEKRAGM